MARPCRVGFGVSERRARRVAKVPRSTCQCRGVARDRSALRRRPRDLAAVRVRGGHRRLRVLLRREGWPVNHRRVYRLCREEGLGIRVRRRRKRVSGPRVLPPPAQRPLERWSPGFLPDSLADGRRLRVLMMVDDSSRASPAIEAGHSSTGERVAAVLERLERTARTPERVAADNGPECIPEAMEAWACRSRVQLGFSRPGKPANHAFAERCNGRFRDECLDQHGFASLEEARRVVADWRVESNTERPHQALGQQTPAAWAAARVPPTDTLGQPSKWTNPGGRSGGASPNPSGGPGSGVPVTAMC